MNTAIKISSNFDEYMSRFVYKALGRSYFIEESEPIKQQRRKPTAEPVAVNKRPAPIKAKTYRVIRRHVMANTNDLLSRRHELSEEQNEMIDRVFYLKWLASNKASHVEQPESSDPVLAKPSVDLLASHSEPVVVKQEDPKDVKRRARAALSNRSDSQRVVDRYIKENKKELLARRHELSAEQNEAIDNFLRLEALAGDE